MPKSPQEMVAAIVRNLPSKTGKPLEHWVKLARTQGPADKKALVDWLKTVHGLGDIQAKVVADERLHPGRTMAAAYDDPKALLDAQYAGDRAGLRGIQDTLVRAAKKLGKDVHVDVRKTYVALARKAQFAVIRPASKTRVDLSLHLPGVPHGDRFADISEPGERMTHRIGLAAAKEVDAELLGYLRAAYDASGR